ncbi:hypothetical protein CBR_g37778 [Chara braunii]|uniref:Reverse transcriptase domain-containing protein n=1 Tax=Chara braunii TaxID=69332 RepID=A0A388LNK9_CHABU|nr:hypothetical protein CBR_g37778 [Chara braunii]|eukprot:GBG83907.1 hypothetical protein CBR_g37778 [Chara braunii]
MLRQLAEAFFGAVRNPEGTWAIDGDGRETITFDLYPALRSQGLERLAVAQAYYGRPEVRGVTSETPWCDNCRRHRHLARRGCCLTMAETKEELVRREQLLRADPGLASDDTTETACWEDFEKEFNNVIYTEIATESSLGDVMEVGDRRLLQPSLPRHSQNIDGIRGARTRQAATPDQGSNKASAKKSQAREDVHRRGGQERQKPPQSASDRHHDGRQKSGMQPLSGDQTQRAERMQQERQQLRQQQQQPPHQAPPPPHQPAPDAAQPQPQGGGGRQKSDMQPLGGDHTQRAERMQQERQQQQQPPHQAPPPPHQPAPDAAQPQPQGGGQQRQAPAGPRPLNHQACITPRDVIVLSGDTLSEKAVVGEDGDQREDDSHPVAMECCEDFDEQTKGQRLRRQKRDTSPKTRDHVDKDGRGENPQPYEPLRLHWKEGDGDREVAPGALAENSEGDGDKGSKGLKQTDQREEEGAMGGGVVGEEKKDTNGDRNEKLEVGEEGKKATILGMEEGQARGVERTEQEPPRRDQKTQHQRRQQRRGDARGLGRGKQAAASKPKGRPKSTRGRLAAGDSGPLLRPHSQKAKRKPKARVLCYGSASRGRYSRQKDKTGRCQQKTTPQAVATSDPTPEAEFELLKGINDLKIVPPQQQEGSRDQEERPSQSSRGTNAKRGRQRRQGRGRTSREASPVDLPDESEQDKRRKTSEPTLRTKPPPATVPAWMFSDPAYKAFILQHWEYWTELRSPSQPTLTWLMEGTAALVRLLKARAAASRRARRRTAEEFSQRALDLGDGPGPQDDENDWWAQWAALKAQWEEWQLTDADLWARKNIANWTAAAERMSKIFFAQLRADRPPSLMLAINHPFDDSQQTAESTQTILHYVEEYYRYLFSEEKPAGAQDPLETLEHLIWSKIARTVSPEERQRLDEPITDRELAAALVDMPPAKAPGPDGMSAEHLKLCFELLGPYLLWGFNAVWLGQEALPPDFALATVILIHKKGPLKEI